MTESNCAPPQITAAAAVGYLIGGIFPDLTQHRALSVGIGVHGTTEFVKELVTELIRHIQSPTVDAEAAPMGCDAVLSGEISAAIGIVLIEPRKGLHAPPALIIVREAAEGVPSRIGR